MALVDFLFDNVESFFAWSSLLLKQSHASYCDLETADSQHVLVTKNGSLISVIKIDGFRRFVGKSEFDQLCQRFVESIQTAFSSEGHFIQIYFNYSPENISYYINEALHSAKETAERVCLSIDDIFESRKKVLEDVCSHEDCFFIIWTEPSALSTKHIKNASKDKLDKIKSYNLPNARRAANLFLGLPELRNLHDSLISTMVDDLQQIGFYIKLLDVHSAVYEARNSIDPNFTAPTWKPFLPGDTIPVRLQQECNDDKSRDISDILWPPLSSQVIPREGENIDLKMARVGDTIYSPLYIELFPKSTRPFYDLFRRAALADLPWRASFYIAGNGIKVTQSKKWLAQFLTFSSYHNKLIVESHKLLKYLDERGDDPIIKLKMVVLTWAPAGKMHLLKQRAAKLAQLVQAWGGCEVKEFYGDPYGEVLSTTVAVRNKSTATTTGAPLSEVVKMLPITRPASPWKRGALLFRTPDGKLWPYQPGSNHQVSWIDIIYARSGSGKSVLLNSLNLGLCLSPGLSQLPRIAIIDIGPSSKGFISLLKEGLASEDKNIVIYHRLKLEDGHAINPFDTQLGARFPTKLHRSFLINLLSLLYVERVKDDIPNGMSGMLSLLVDELYRQFSDSEQPKPYIPHMDSYLEEKISQINIEINPEMTWWQLTDSLFEKGYFDLAIRAQKYAMPILADTISTAHFHGIKDIYSKVSLPGTQEDFISAFCRTMSAVIRNFPTLTSPTQLSLEKARIIAFDLEDVARSGSAAAEKQTAVMYMLARHAMAQHYFLRHDDIRSFPRNYHPYHEERVREILEEPKRIVYDEFHRTANSPSVREQVIQDMREGRKWKIQISLASQALQDFDKLMVDFATGVFILDSGSTQSIEETCKTFGLNETEKYALATRVHGPKSSGATFIAQFVTKQGVNTQLLTSTISAVELWAFNTTTEDVYIRESLYKILGPEEARRRLAIKYPRGSATKEIEALIDENHELTLDSACKLVLKQLLNGFYEDDENNNEV
ncbi:ATPase AAA [Piscirickettsia salmonis]|uniref:ATPase AAA n=1 Tax=Piscirickettsia salmonis TaxID=1238 RepID=UPI00031816F6|nr:ATPase AAA [Piscirickettsia salmonis]ERL63167.1 AAA-like domain protein [Piscirickettsia salmonis LF-89 = ATCC VR-1361]PEQ16831.1 AAA family ATPase [Piscirickettsia salmonis]QGN78279.1 intracellular multiplication protein IcmB [Piscirickettsia salmonis]QGN81860.1 intracellular multiplication protein IcmB [Piscirickettsia salmonis]QGN83867.1 intracellular multiplication protein IcmB [Piscirickettsia salmonis]